MKIKDVSLPIAALFSLCTIASLIMAAPAHSDKYNLRLGAKGEICLKCHETVKENLRSRFSHPLAKKGECTGCHDPHTSSHQNLLTADTTKLCYSCHKEVLPENARSTHETAMGGNCRKCHDPHGSNNKFILVKSGEELCFDCHKDINDDVRFKHRSLKKDKGCLNCHNPHASTKSKHLLQTEVPSLCNKCHNTDKLSFKRKHMNYPVANSDCGSCHNPHGSNKRGMVFDVAHTAVFEGKCADCHQEPTSLKTKKQTTQLCSECHRDMVEKTLNKYRVHWPLVDKVGCMNCHNPHATKEQKLLRGTLIDVCGKCHGDTVELQELSKKNPKNEKLCEPVKSGNCTSCHSPHSSDNFLSTNSSISSDLCRDCHEWQSHSTHPIGEKAIDQRNKNLTVECLSCHLGCGTGNNPAMLPFNTTYELCIQCHVDRIR